MKKFLSVILAAYMLTVLFAAAQGPAVVSRILQIGTNGVLRTVTPVEFRQANEIAGAGDVAEIRTGLDRRASWKSLVEAVSEPVTAAAAGATTNQMPLFVDAAEGWTANWIDRYPGTGVTVRTVIRNTNCWAAGFNLTCISPWNSRGLNKRGGTLITRRHMVGVNHWPLSTGDTVVFIGPANQVVTRTISKSARVGSTDIQLYELDSDVPDYITPAKLPGAAWMSAMPSGAVGIGTDQRELVGTLSIAAGSSAAYGDLGITFGMDDSGNPTGWITQEGDFVLAWSRRTVSSGDIVQNSVSDIRAQIAAWGDLGTVTEYEHVDVYDGLAKKLGAKVPYTGAVSNLDLGSFSLAAAGVTIGGINAATANDVAARLERSTDRYTFVTGTSPTNRGANLLAAYATLKAAVTVNTNSIIIAGAGTSAVNGTYVLDGSGYYLQSGGSGVIWNSGGTPPYGPWRLSYSDADQYGSADKLTWLPIGGASPAPTGTHPSNVSVTDRIQIILTPGVYDLGTNTLALGTDYIDLVGLGDLGAVRITGTVTRTATDAKISRVTINGTPHGEAPVKATDITATGRISGDGSGLTGVPVSTNALQLGGVAASGYLLAVKPQATDTNASWTFTGRQFVEMVVESDYRTTGDGWNPRIMISDGTNIWNAAATSEHGSTIPNGDPVLISGATPAAFNGVWKVVGGGIAPANDNPFPGVLAGERYQQFASTISATNATTLGSCSPGQWFLEFEGASAGVGFAGTMLTQSLLGGTPGGWETRWGVFRSSIWQFPTGASASQVTASSYTPTIATFSSDTTNRIAVGYFTARVAAATSIGRYSHWIRAGVRGDFTVRVITAPTGW